MDVQLRAWSLADLDRLVLLANNPGIAANLTDGFPHPYTRDSGEYFIGMAMSKSPPSILAITVDSQIAGGIGVHPQTDIYRKNAELGYCIAEEYWGKGIVSQAIALMLKYAFNNFDMDRIFARPFGPNKASQRVLEKNGFQLEARLHNTFFKNGVYLDELIYSIRRP